MAKQICLAGAILVWTMVALLAAQSSAQPARETTSNLYVLMVTSLDPPIEKLTDAQVKLLNGTPFHGVAISIFGIYDGGTLPEEAKLLARCAELRKLSKKTIWPRVYLNRMIGFLPKVSRRKACQNPEYFDRIKGFDLWDEAGARTDFLRLWRLSLRGAKVLGAPGVVADFESYNCGGLANPITLAKETGRSLEDTQAALRELGGKLTDIIAEEYPEAIAWSLFTELGRTDHYWNKTPSTPPLLALHAYIFEGMLSRAKERSAPFTLVSGGEDDIGYYNASRNALRQKIAAKANAFQPWLNRFSNRLALGGTITVWNDDTKLTGWAREAAGHAPPFKCFADFKPMLEELFRAYPYIWLYVPMVTDYNPFDAKTAPALNAKLREVIEASQPRPDR